MTIDRYTKVVLTVIALSLSVIALQLSSKEAHAQQQSLMFAPNGALIVTLCDPAGTRARLTCADVLNEGLTVTTRR